jgi:hypothetical protein
MRTAYTRLEKEGSAMRATYYKKAESGLREKNTTMLA